MDFKEKQGKNEQPESSTPDQIEARQSEKLAENLQKNEGFSLRKLAEKISNPKLRKKVESYIRAAAGVTAVALLGSTAGDFLELDAAYAGGTPIEHTFTGAREANRQQKLEHIKDVVVNGNSVEFTNTLGHHRESLSMGEFANQYGDPYGNVDLENGVLNTRTQQIESTNIAGKPSRESTEGKRTKIEVKKKNIEEDDGGGLLQSVGNNNNNNVDKGKSPAQKKTTDKSWLPKTEINK